MCRNIRSLQTDVTDSEKRGIIKWREIQKQEEYHENEITE